MAKEFFTEQSEQSQVKAAIVQKYFWTWAKIITGYLKKSGESQKIAYIDLFAGPGRYENGAKSTPLLIMEEAIKDPQFRDNLVTLFNDKDEKNVGALQEAFSKLDGIGTLKYEPSVYCEEVGDEIVKTFESWNLIPTLLFVDPWGYKGLSLRLVNSVLKDWACECIFFFNYNRINMGLTNPFVKEHMSALFGEDRAAELAVKLKSMDADQRQLTIVEELCQALKEMGGRYVLPFRFLDKRGTRTSHHLIFVSKHPLGYGIMKQIMAKECTTKDQGVPTFEYNPADKRQKLLFELTRPLDDLEGMLLKQYSGKTLTMKEIYDEHNIDRPYIEPNYKEALRKMELAGKITADPPHTARRKYKGEASFAATVSVTFPPERKGKS